MLKFKRKFRRLKVKSLSHLSTWYPSESVLLCWILVLYQHFIVRLEKVLLILVLSFAVSLVLWLLYRSCSFSFGPTITRGEGASLSQEDLSNGTRPTRPVFLNRWTAARCRALASIIPGRERPEETTICYKISLVELINNLNVILYLSTCHTVYINVLIFFMILP